MPPLISTSSRTARGASRCAPWTRTASPPGSSFPSSRLAAPPLDLELDRDDRDRPAAAIAVDPQGQPPADPLRDHQALEVPHVSEGLAVYLDDQVLGPQSRLGGRATLDHLDHLDPLAAAELGREPRRQRTRAAGDPEVGAPDAALAHQLRDDAT